jgi:hypothetical protein
MASTPVKKERVSLFLDEPLLDGLRELKERDGMAAAEAIRRAVAAFLREKGIAVEPRKPRKARQR